MSNEDIESLGWEWKKEGYTAFYWKPEYKLIYNRGPNRLHIGKYYPEIGYDKNNDVGIGTVFSGVIETKSELEVLMKQLEIK